MYDFQNSADERFQPCLDALTAFMQDMQSDPAIRPTGFNGLLGRIFAVHHDAVLRISADHLYSVEDPGTDDLVYLNPDQIFVYGLPVSSVERSLILPGLKAGAKPLSFTVRHDFRTDQISIWSEGDGQRGTEIYLDSSEDIRACLDEWFQKAIQPPVSHKIRKSTMAPGAFPL